jgi:predicted transcriptional regulator
MHRAKRAKWIPETSPAELAEKCAELSRRRMSGMQIAEHLGLSKNHVNNLLRVKRDLVGELWNEFEKGRLSTDWAFKLARVKDTKEQLRRYAAGNAEVGQIRKSKVHDLLRACENSKRSDEWKQGASDALECLLGKKRMAGIWPRSR